jgi:hypothetical protein
MFCVQEEKSLMMPISGKDEVMQIQEVLIILGKENIALTDGIRKMLGVRDPSVPNCRWEQPDVAHPMQLGHHAPISDIVIQVKSHAHGAPLTGT